jgi:hypothetical protein
MEKSGEMAREGKKGGGFSWKKGGGEEGGN